MLRIIRMLCSLTIKRHHRISWIFRPAADFTDEGFDDYCIRKALHHNEKFSITLMNLSVMYIVLLVLQILLVIQVEAW